MYYAEPETADLKRLATGGGLAAACAVPIRWPVASVTLSTLVTSQGQPSAQLADLTMIQLLGVVAVALCSSFAISLATEAVSTLGFDFLLDPPTGSSAMVDMKSLLTLLGLLIVAGVVSRQHDRVRLRRGARPGSSLRTSRGSARLPGRSAP